MEALKTLFGDKSSSYDEFAAALKANEETIKLANLKDGEYVARQKYTDLEADLKKQIEAKGKELDEIKKQSKDHPHMRGEHLMTRH